MRILFMGNKDRGVKCLEALANEHEEIVGVVAHPDVFGSGSVASKAEELGIELFQPQKINSRHMIERIGQLKPELIVMAGYNYLVGKEILEIPDCGVINLHGARLPEYRGASVSNWVIVNGEMESAATVIYASEGYDTGDILSEQRFEIKPEDTIAEILQKSLEAFPPLLIKTVDEIKSGELKPRKQDNGKACYYHSLSPEYSEPVDWNNMGAEQIHNWVRALTHPYNGAYTHANDRKLTLWKTSLLNETFRGIPGKICYSKDEGVVVVARDRGLLVERVQEQGKEDVSAREYFKENNVKYLR